MRLDIEPQPPRIGLASITLSLTASGQALRGAQVAIEGDMSHPGMPPMFGQAIETELGVYRGQLRFTMPGDWVVIAHIRLADGQKLDRQVAIRGVRPN